LQPIPLAAAAAAAMPVHRVDDASAGDLVHGRGIAADQVAGADEPMAAVDQSGTLVALVRLDPERGELRPLAVFARPPERVPADAIADTVSDAPAG
jgi:hypothetical protein